jgi:hypothetical protein
MQVDLSKGNVVATMTVAEAVNALAAILAPKKVTPAAPPAGAPAAGGFGGIQNTVNDSNFAATVAARSAEILPGLRSLDWSDYEAAFRKAATMAKAAGWSSGEIGQALGINPWDIREDAHKFGIPAFDVGSTGIITTGLAMVHQGEKIIPAKSAGVWNDGGMADTAEAAREQLRVSVQIMVNTRKTADILDRFDINGMPPVRAA